jgi:hypothetical protein
VGRKPSGASTPAVSGDSPKPAAIIPKGGGQVRSGTPVHTKERVEKLLAVYENGMELYGYSDEEDMLDEPSESDYLLEMPDLDLAPIEEEVGMDTDIYAEPLILDEPSIVAMRPPPKPTTKANTGTRKAKKKKAVSDEEEDLSG